MKTPDQVRDKIHVSLLALAYTQSATCKPLDDFEELGPSEYMESNGAYALRFARKMQPRAQLRYRVELSTQTDFPEPATRIDTDRPNAAELGSSEAAGLDELASYYKGIFTSALPK